MSKNWERTFNFVIKMGSSLRVLKYPKLMVLSLCCFFKYPEPAGSLDSGIFFQIPGTDGSWKNQGTAPTLDISVSDLLIGVDVTDDEWHNR